MPKTSGSVISCGQTTDDTLSAREVISGLLVINVAGQRIRSLLPMVSTTLTHV